MRAVTHYDVDRAPCAQALEPSPKPGGIMQSPLHPLKRHNGPINCMLRFSILLLAGAVCLRAAIHDFHRRRRRAARHARGGRQHVHRSAAQASLLTPAAMSISAAATPSSRSMRAGTLTLIAGNSRAGFSGDGGPAVNAQLNTPAGHRGRFRRQSLHRRLRQQSRPQSRYQRHHHHLRRQRQRRQLGPASGAMAASPPTPFSTCPLAVAVD